MYNRVWLFRYCQPDRACSAVRKMLRTPAQNHGPDSNLYLKNRISIRKSRASAEYWADNEYCLLSVCPAKKAGSHKQATRYSQNANVLSDEYQYSVPHHTIPLFP